MFAVTGNAVMLPQTPRCPSSIWRNWCYRDTFQ
jgi:hypothetical protein